MKVRDAEGVAIHSSHESCVGGGDPDGEALTGGDAGRVSSRERHFDRGADPVGNRGRPHQGGRSRKSVLDPARSKTSCMYPRTSSGNGEISGPTLCHGGRVRAGNPTGASQQ